MNEFLGFRQRIEGNNANIHNCMDCGKALSQGEYNEMVDMCKSCKRKGYNAGRQQSKDELGNNKIDEILLKKMGGSDN